MSDLTDGLRAAQFFAGFLPSFTRIGHCVRRVGWREAPCDFSGQRWVVTGASAGIGNAIARRAAESGATVLAVARSADRLAALTDACRAAPGRIEPVALDLALVANTRALLDRIRDAGTIDVLVNNVGMLPAAPDQTPEGLERAFAINLLNPWLLTQGLRARRLFVHGAAVIDMSSGGMYNVALDLARLERFGAGAGALAYARHKRAQVVLNTALVQACAAQGEDLRPYVMHPGWVDTPGVATSMPAFHRLLRPLLRDVAAGADTALWLAATRPTPRADRVWFDRAPRPTHVFPGTRRGDSAAALIDYLEQRVAAAGHSSATPEPIEPAA